LLDLSDRAELELLAMLIADVQGATPGTDWMLVGATARDLRLTSAHGIRTTRATADVDLAVATVDWPRHLANWRALSATGSFSEVHRHHRIRHRSGCPVDLIPFEGVEDPPGRIEWPGRQGDDTMRVTGYREARAAADEVRLPGGVVIAVPTLPGLILLKLFAFEDRATSDPRKDAEDIGVILDNYIDAGNKGRLFSEFAYLLESEDFDYIEAGFLMAGRDLRELLVTNDLGNDLRTPLLALLDRELDPEGRNQLAAQSGDDPNDFLRFLASFRRGLTM
jgi:predicted nucleotidyltransferase